MFLNFTKKGLLVAFSLSLLKFGVGFVSGMVIPIFPSLIALHFKKDMNSSLDNGTNYNYYHLSILFVTKNLCQIVASPIVGCLADIFGAMVVIMSGTIFQILSMLVYSLGNAYYMLLLGRVFEAIAASVLNCATAAFVAYRFKDHKQRGFVYGVKALSTCVGYALGPAYGGVVYQYYGKTVVFLSFIAFVFLEILFLLWVIVVENKAVEDIDPPKGQRGSMESLKEAMLMEKSDTINGDVQVVQRSSLTSKKGFPGHSLFFFKDPYFLLSIGAFPVIFVSIYLLFSSLPRYMALRFHSTESRQGLIWIVTLVGYGLGFISGNVVNTRLAAQRHMILSSFACLHALAVIGIPFMPTWWSVAVPLCVIVYVHLVVEVVISPILATIVETRHDSRFGVMSGVVMMVMAITGSLGSFLGPLLLSSIGFKYMSVAVCVLSVIYAPFFLFLRRFCQVQ